MFKFEFDLDDLTNQTNQQPQEIQPSQAEDLQPDKEPVSDQGQDPCVVIPFKELIDRLPPFITYSNLKIDDSLSIYKRELYDAKYQTIVNLAEEEEEEREEEQDQEGGEDGKEGAQKGEEQKTRQKTLDSLQSTSDLIPGVYEGGFKTWECSLDLATHLDPIFERVKTVFSKQQQEEEEDHPSRKNILDQNRDQGEDIWPYRILEIGCGTAVPTVSLCFKLFAFLLARNRDPRLDSSFDHQQELESPILEIILQDFNADAFYRATMLTSKLKQADVSQEREEDGNSTKARMDGEEEIIEEDLEITDELKTEFELFLSENRIRLTLIYGPWSTFELPGSLPSTSSNLTLSVAGNDGKRRRKGCEVIMSSETLYSTASLPDLINVLLSSKINNLIHQTDDAQQRQEEEEEGKEEGHSTTILIASKSVYFGVGGGTHSFVNLVENTHNGTVEFVDLHHHSGPTSTGISRVLMDVKFSS